jgi:hypothetical protein
VNPFDSRGGSLAQDKPFDSREGSLAQDKPFDSREGSLAQDRQGVTESEAVAIALLLFAGGVVILSWICGSALVIFPVPIVLASVAIAAASLRALVRDQAVDRSNVRLAAFLFIVAGLFSYLCWLAWPSLLPIGEAPDLVHHLILIRFIQRRHVLLHDHSFGQYLGEMDGYTPGSHLLTAVIADTLGLDGLRVVHPIGAAFVAIKAGVLYSIVLRVLPPGRRHPAAALAGALLLLVPHAYLIRSLTWFHFFAQVVAETFAVTMVWCAVVWHQQGGRRWLVVFGIFGIAVMLSWPVWLPAPALMLAIVVLADRTARWSTRVLNLLIAGAPIATVAAIYSATHTKSASVLASGGSTLEPSAAILPWVFVCLAAAGAAIAIVRRDTTVVILAFLAACAIEIIGLVVLQRALGASNFYLAYKTVHLVVYGAVVLGAVALEGLWHVCRQLAVPDRGVWLLPVLVAIWVWRGDLPRRPLPSPITEPVYHAGLVAKAQLPSACVDYLVEHWLTAYWLHVDVLGNPRGSLEGGRFGYRETVGRWIQPGSLPYAIAGDVDRLPNDVRQNIKVIARFGPAAVIERADGRGVCRDSTPPIDRIPLSH